MRKISGKQFSVTRNRRDEVADIVYILHITHYAQIFIRSTLTHTVVVKQ